MSDLLTAIVKPTHNCNLACTYCYIDPNAEAGRMNTKTLVNMTNQLVNTSGKDRIRVIWHGGEPMLMGRDFYEEAIAIQKKSKKNKLIENSIQTNGTLIDEKFLDFLEAQINSGGYQLTHAVIALIWLRENQCIINEKRTKGMINTSINLLLELAKKERYNTDIGIEAMAVLCYSGNYKKIKPFMISEVLKVQKANGSWAHSPETTITDEHTTILAFWLLLGVEYHRLNPAVKWIVK